MAKTSNETKNNFFSKSLKFRSFCVTPEIFSDSEVMELLLNLNIKKNSKKSKYLAKKLLKDFGNFNEVLNAEKDRLLAIEGVNYYNYVSFCLIRDSIKRVLKYKILKKNIINSESAIINYLQFSMAHLKKEQLRILFLNKGNNLIIDEVMATGTIDQIFIFPREIIERALFYKACSIVLVHNHPSGSLIPSKLDIKLTSKIVEACKTMDIKVHDHLIITKEGFFSFKNYIRELEQNISKPLKSC